MKEFIRSITKVTVAFVLIFMLVGCGNVSEMTQPVDPTVTLPYTGPLINVTESSDDIETEPVSTEQVTIEIPETTEQIETTSTIETTEIESTKEETTTVEVTEPVVTTPIVTEPETTAEPETTVPAPTYTFKSMDTYMYVQAPVNVRTLPSTDGEIVISFEVNHRVYVNGQCNETGWYRINLEGQTFYISGSYLGLEKVVITKSAQPTNKSYNTSGFVYYTVAGRWPEKAYEEYLYSCLVDRGIAWWYPYAIAQIWAESCWTPTSYNGVDAGICQFNEKMFPARAAHHANFPDADVWNPYDSLYVYSFYIRDILAACGNDIEAAWSYYIKGHFNDHHAVYCNACWKWYNSLEAQ